MKRNEKFILILAGLILASGFIFIGCKNQSSDSKNSSFFEKGDHIIKNAVKDIDGNSYDAVKLGNQVWMAENLRTTSGCNRLYDGVVYENNKIDNDIIISPSYNPVNPGLLYVEGTKGGNEIYYNNYAASQELCPQGWHLPSLADWQQMENYLKTKPEYIAGNCEANVAKSLASKEGWDYYTEPTPEDYGKIAYNPMSTNNATNFSAKPVGYISVENNPKRDLIGLDIFGVGESAYFWTSSTNIDDENAYICLYCSEPTISVDWDIKAEHPDFYGSFHDHFISVRCVKNE